MSTITFVEVDHEDTDAISVKFPKSNIFADKLQDALAQCKDTTILSCFIYSIIGKKELDSLPHIKLLCTRSVGTDHIDLNECTKRGITVCNVPDYGSHVIAEHVFALLLSATRRIREADERVEHGTFDYHGLRGIALKGKTIGVIGTGKIGRRVCQIAHGFDMNILAYDVVKTSELSACNVTYVPLQELLNNSDIITLHTPATPKTQHMINKKTIAAMRDGVIIVNTARGSLIETHALVEGLKQKKIRYALLDVLEHEQNFEENKELIALPEVIITPHVAFLADDSMRNIYHDTFESIDRFIKQKMFQ